MVGHLNSRHSPTDAVVALLDDAIAALKLHRTDETVHAARKGPSRYGRLCD
jgi:hypothetical protein